MRSNGKSGAGSSDLLNKFSARLEMTDNRNLIWFTAVGRTRLLRFAGHRLRNRKPRRCGSKISHRAKSYANRERQTAFGAARPREIMDGQECSPWSAFWTEACWTLGGGKSGCAPSVSVAAAL